MNKTTTDKISAMSDRLWKIHEDRAAYRFIIPLLDEPYQLALEIMEFDFDLDPREVANALSLNWQTVQQVRKALQG